jgi:hypothetical protein
MLRLWERWPAKERSHDKSYITNDKRVLYIYVYICVCLLATNGGAMKKMGGGGCRRGNGGAGIVRTGRMRGKMIHYGGKMTMPVFSLEPASFRKRWSI